MTLQDERARQLVYCCAHGTHMPRQAARLAEVFAALSFTDQRELARLGLELKVPTRMVQRAGAIRNQDPEGATSILDAAEEIFGKWRVRRLKKRFERRQPILQAA